MDEEKLSSRLAEIARDIQSKESVSQASEEIVGAAKDLLADGTEAGITLVHRHRRLDTPAATSDLVRRGDELQYELREGPCLDAAWEQDQVYSGDLGRDGRWPRWGPRIAESLGVHSMLCTQLFTNENQMGALNIYSGHHDAFDEEAHEVARLLAAHAAVAVAAAQEIATLKVAVDRRTTIGKGLGILMARYDLDDDKALAVLRRVSQHTNRKLYDIAEEVIRTHRLPSG